MLSVQPSSEYPVDLIAVALEMMKVRCSFYYSMTRSNRCRICYRTANKKAGRTSKICVCHGRWVKWSTSHP